MLYENEILEYCRKQDEHLASAEYLELIDYMKMYYFVITKRDVHEDFPEFFTWSRETVQARLSEWRMKCMEELTSVYPDSVTTIATMMDFAAHIMWLFPFQSGVRVRDDLDGGKIRVIRKVDYDEFGNAGVWLNSEYLDGGRHPWEISNPVAI